MKKILLLIILFFNLIPVLKEGKMKFAGAFEAMANEDYSSENGWNDCYGDENCDEAFDNCYGTFNYSAGLALGQLDILEGNCFDIVGPTMENVAEAYLDSQNLPSSPPPDDFWEFIVSLIDSNASQAAEYYECLETAQEVYGDMLDQAGDTWEECLNSYN